MAEEKNPKHRGCGTMEVHRRMLDTDPEYARRLTRIEEHAFRASMSPMLRPGCTQIPVVVHVVYKTAAQNISQAQIDSQMDVLNRDFRKKNGDISTVPAPFAPLVGDARIEFKLATTDPDGNPTSGVTRTETNKSSFGSNDDVKFTAQGGIDAWPRDDYLNIWVCQLSGGLLGYAQFPGGAAATDGVVCTHTGFGTTGTAAAPFDKGRTTTHEIGHWLNLRHIWGDDGGGCSGTDFVADTPNQAGPNTGKPTFPSITCSNGPNGDMFMNYMDYVDDDTMVMFTEGQIARMQACLDGPRSAIGTTIPCVDIGPKLPHKDGPKELPKDVIKEFPKDPPKEFPKDSPKELPKDPPKDFHKDPPKELPKDSPKDFHKDPPKELPKDPPKDFHKDPPKELPKDPPKDFHKDPPKDLPKDPPKDFHKDPPKDGPKDLGKEPIKDIIKEGPLDPGPGKIPKLDPGPKNVLGDIPPKSVQDPPKSFLEPPIDLPGAPVVQPTIPLQPVQPAQPGVPFVLGTGAPQAQPQDARAQYLAHYAQILQQYADLNQRGMLDAQGLAAWQQAWAAYQQLGGS